MTLSRRHLIAGAASGLFSATLPSFARAATLPGISGAPGRLRTYMLMRGALDEALSISCIACRYSGVVDAEMTPFYDLEAVTFARFRRSADGGFQAVSFEIEYFIDPATGDVLDQWHNPYSGKVVTARHGDSSPMTYSVGPDLTLGLPQLLVPGTQLTREAPRFDSRGDDVWMVEKTVATIPVAGARPMHFNEMVTYHAKAVDLLRPGTTRAAADVSYLGVSSFRPWQAMGERSGNLIGQGLGASNMTLADAPPRWLAITQRRHPEALTDPSAYLQPLWSKR